MKKPIKHNIDFSQITKEDFDRIYNNYLEWMEDIPLKPLSKYELLQVALNNDEITLSKFCELTKNILS